MCNANNSTAKAQSIVLPMIIKGHNKLVTIFVSSPLMQAYTVHIEHIFTSPHSLQVKIWWREKHNINNNKNCLELPQTWSLKRVRLLRQIKYGNFTTLEHTRKITYSSQCTHSRKRRLLQYKPSICQSAEMMVLSEVLKITT